jgi:hypothetical protein
LKYGFRSELIEKTVLVPEIFSGYSYMCSGMSTKTGGKITAGFAMNLSYTVGDDPAIVELNRDTFFSQFGIFKSNLAIPVQSHSANVRRVAIPGTYDNCDGLITDAKGVALVVTVADCVPILLFDPRKNVVGALHAGWRGTAQSIVRQAIQIMHEEYKTDSKNVLAFIGPSAGSCCYEVSREVAVKFENKIVSYDHTKVFIDLKKENEAQLQQQGLAVGNIEISNHCTICEKQLFHSYRRDGTKSGRMMAFIYLKP